MKYYALCGDRMFPDKNGQWVFREDWQALDETRKHSDNESQHNRIVAETTAERDKAIRERIMAERSNDILDRIREAKRGPLENYVGHVLDDAAAEIESLRSRQTCEGGKPYVCHELAAVRSQLKAATKELDEASPMTRCDCCGSSFRLHKMVIEEGDRWECYPCWEALNERERSK